MKFSIATLLFFAALLYMPIGVAHAATAPASPTIMKSSWYKSPWSNGVAHRKLPKGTILRIENPKTGAITWGVVNDRGPYIKGRDLDVSAEIAAILGIVDQGVAKLKVSIVYTPPKKS